VISTRTSLALAIVLAGFGFICGVLFQEFFGAGRILQAVLTPWPSRTSATAEGVDSAEVGLPEALFGRLSLFVLAGQSNMSGYGPLPDTQQVHPRIYVFGNDYRWRPALEPLDSPEGQVDEVSVDRVAPSSGFGPGHSFALELADSVRELTIGLIPCAKGNSTIDDWKRSLSDRALYGSCLKRIRAASPAGSVAAILFFQGEADALDPGLNPDRVLAPEVYAERFSTVIEDLRWDLSLPTLPVVFAQIGSQGAPRAFSNWELIQRQQRMVSLPCSSMITTADLPIFDGVHFTTESYRIIGRRFASAYAELAESPSCG
jgi:hypothetical protein